MTTSAAGRPPLLRLRFLRLFLLPPLAFAGPFLGYDPSLGLHPDDLDAVRRFRDAIRDDDGLLQTWTDDVDPCAGWEGVDCDCTKLYPLPPDPHPCPDVAPADYNRVYRLDFGPRKPSNKRLHGTYTPWLANLTEARQFYLHVNKFEGTIPSELGQLKKLQRLLFRDNVLTGTIPTELGDAWGLKDLYVDNNNLVGELPSTLCDVVEREDSILNVVQPSINPGLCGVVPQCLHGKYLNPLHVVGTHLIYPPADEVDPTRVVGFCSDAAPTCDRDDDCFVAAPSVVSSLTAFDFGFTNFSDPIGMRSYEWCIGTDPGVCDAQAWTPYVYAGETTSMAPSGKVVEVNAVTYTAQGVSLMNGELYYVNIVGQNMAGPPLQTNITSSVILTDNTPPVPATIKPVADCGEVSSGDQHDTTEVDICWDEFVELESSVTTYHVGLEVRGGNVVVDLVEVEGNATSYTLRNLALVPGKEYFGIVQATNAAGLTGIGKSQSLRIVSPEESNPSWIIVLAVLIPLLVIVFAVFFKARQRLLKQIRLEKWHSDNAARLQELRNGGRRARRRDSSGNSIIDGDDLVEQEIALVFGRSSNESTDIYFVFTDIRDSTNISQLNPAAHTIIQQVHDGVMRQCIDDNNGYEINTQGDAFEVAFLSAPCAASFCLDIQKRLLQVDWPKDVLKLQACRRERDADGSLLFAGPRVRIGIHKAHREGLTRRVHDLTKHVVFGGSEFLLGRAIGDCAHGGQVLCSSEAAVDILSSAKASNWANLRYVGDYAIHSSNMAIYELLPSWGSLEPRRGFPLTLSGAKLVKDSKDPTLRISPHPDVDAGSDLPVCIVRISEYGVVEKSEGGEALVEEIIASLAQNYGGYIVNLSLVDENLRLVVFHDSASALQFTLLLNVAFLYAPWEHSIDGFHQVSSFASEYDQSGSLIWRGPKVSTVLDRIDCSFLKDEGNGTHTKGINTIDAPGLALPNHLVDLINDGQTVLTDSMWQSLQHRSTSCVFVSLGKISLRGIKGEFSLMQAKPKILQGRSFSMIECDNQISPGYYHAPHPSEGVAIVFCVPEGLGDSDANGLSAEDRMAILRRWCEIVRSKLERYNGYESKEVDGGKFLCAFRTYQDAIIFASSVQATLRDNPGEWILPHMATALKSPYLRVAIGMSFGLQLFRKPQRASGRADYFGIIPNLSARITGQAKPGQTLLCVVSEAGVMDFATRNEDGTGAKMVYSDSEIVSIRSMGAVQLKGFDFHPTLAECSMENTETEDFGKPKDWIGLVAPSQVASRKASTSSCFSSGAEVTPLGTKGARASRFGRRSSNDSSGASRRQVPAFLASAMSSRRSSDNLSANFESIDI